MNTEIRTIVTHADCADGIMSALILHHVFPGANVQFVQYDSPSRNDLPVTEGMLFCDMTPLPARTQEFVDAGAVVLDHHAGAEHTVRLFGKRGQFASEPGVSGAVLAARYVGLGEGSALCRLARYVGVYDTWQTDHPDWRLACEITEALKWWGYDRLKDRDGYGLDAAFMLGSVLLEKRQEAVEQAYAEITWLATASGLRLAICQCDSATLNLLSDRVGDTADVVIGFHATAGKYRFSMRRRSSSSVNILAIAQSHGGGGHMSACRFTVTSYTDPWTQIGHIFRAATDLWAAR